MKDHKKPNKKDNLSERQLLEFINLMVEKLVEDLVVEEKPLLEAPGGRGRLRDIFLEPAKDVIQTAGYAVEKLSATAQKLVKGLAYILPTIILPGLKFDYTLFAKDEQKKFDQIHKKYGDVLARNWEAVKDPDVFGFLFLAYPQTMLGFGLLKRSPMAFLQILEMATGGNETVRKTREWFEASGAYSPRTTQHSDPYGGGGGGMGGSYGAAGDYGGGYGGGFGESRLRGSQRPLCKSSAQPSAQPFVQRAVLREEASPQVVQQVQRLMQDPGVRQALTNSPLFADMKKAAVELLVAPVIYFMALQNLDQMKGSGDLSTGLDPSAIEQAKQAVEQNPEYQKGDQQAKQTALDALVKQIKDTYKQEYTKWLQGVGQQNPKAKPTIDQAISQISAIK